MTSFIVDHHALFCSHGHHVLDEIVSANRYHHDHLDNHVSDLDHHSDPYHDDHDCRDHHDVHVLFHNCLSDGYHLDVVRYRPFVCFDDLHNDLHHNFHLNE